MTGIIHKFIDGPGEHISNSLIKRVSLTCTRGRDEERSLRVVQDGERRVISPSTLVRSSARRVYKRLLAPLALLRTRNLVPNTPEALQESNPAKHLTASATSSPRSSKAKHLHVYHTVWLNITAKPCRKQGSLFARIFLTPNCSRQSPWSQFWIRC